MPNDNEQTKETIKDEKLNSMILRLGVLGGFLVISIFISSIDIFNIKKDNFVATSVQATFPISNFEQISIDAKAVYVYDLTEEKILFSKNENSQLPLASIAKLMTALVSSELIPEGTIIKIGESSIKIDGDNGFRVEELWKFKDLLDYTLLVSSNDGAHAIADTAGKFINDSKYVDENPHEKFISKMNEKAVTLGLNQSYFINESGLDVNSTVAGGYGSAKDMSFLVEYIIYNHPKLLEATAYNTLTFTSEDKFVYNAVNTNSAIGNIPGLIASKTGFTDLAGGNLVVVFDAGINHQIIVIVLGSSFDGRFTDIEKLVSASIKELSI